MIRENPASRGTETSAEVLVGPPLGAGGWSETPVNSSGTRLTPTLDGGLEGPPRPVMAPYPFPSASAEKGSKYYYYLQKGTTRPHTHKTRATQHMRPPPPPPRPRRRSRPRRPCAPGRVELTPWHTTSLLLTPCGRRRFVRVQVTAKAPAGDSQPEPAGGAHMFGM